MDSFEWNKIFGAVLFALLFSFGLNIVSETIFEAERPETPGYVIAVAEPEAGAGEEGEAAPAATQPIGVLLASADPAAGEASAKKCATCHTFGQGEPNKVGPNLWETVNRPIAAHEGYEFSEALRAYAAEAQTWTFENLNAFLYDPKGTVPGTKMAFAGLKDDAERGNVIAYMRGLSANPAPLPPPEAAPAEAAAPAEGAPAGEAPAPAEGAPAPAAEAAVPAEGAPADGATAAAQPGAPAEPAPAANAAAVPPAAGSAPSDQTATGEPAATEGPAESGGGAQSPVQTQGSLGAIDSVPADQQGGVPQVPAIEQAEPEPSAEGPLDVPGQSAPPPAAEASAVPAEPAAPAAPATTAETQPAAPAPAEAPPPAAPTAPAPAAPAAAPAAPAAVEPAQPQAPPPTGEAAGAPPAPAAPVVVAPAPAPPPAAAPAAPEQTVAQTAPAPAEPAAPAAPAAPAPAAEAAPGASAADGFAALVAAADVGRGQQVGRRCAACHVFEKGGANRVGPVLWDVVNRPIASVPGYNYSPALTAFAEGGAKTWTVDELNPYLENPRGHVPGTKMAFAGLKSEEERAQVIAYLRSLSDNPVPLP